MRNASAKDIAQENAQGADIVGGQGGVAVAGGLPRGAEAAEDGAPAHVEEDVLRRDSAMDDRRRHAVQMGKGAGDFGPQMQNGVGAGGIAGREAVRKRDGHGLHRVEGGFAFLRVGRVVEGHD